MLSVSFRTMGSHAHALLDAGGAAGDAAIRALPAWFVARERILSRFDPESALSKLNARGGGEHLHPVLWSAIDIALSAAAATDGLVTPTILPALEAAGYDRSFDCLEREQLSPPVASVPEDGGWRRIERDAATRSIRMPAGVRLDLGGTAKGWSADVAAHELGRLGAALVEIGGDVAARRQKSPPWAIGVGDPRDAGGGVLEVVAFGVGGVATSGRDHRRWKRHGIEQHHIVDPRTGAPARTDVLSATVIGPGALEAEIAAKGVLLRGARAGIAWIDARPDLAALVVREDRQLVASARWSRHAWRQAS